MSLRRPRNPQSQLPALIPLTEGKGKSMHSRQKSCVPCAEAKRRCDPQTPSCPRCEKRGVQCYYKNQPLRESAARPDSRDQRRRKRRVEPANQSISPAVRFTIPALSLEDGQDYQTFFSPNFGQDTGFTLEPGWQQDTTASLDQSLLRPNADVSSELFGFETADSVPHLLRRTPSPSPDPSLRITCVPVDSWAVSVVSRNIRSWPSRFARTLQAPFVSLSLYADHDGFGNGRNVADGGSGLNLKLPGPLQDAFAACACYTTTTSANRDVVLGVVERTVRRLVDDIEKYGPRSQKRPALRELWDRGGDAWSPSILSMPREEHVAVLQSLLLLRCIQLWDGDIRQRALAEAQSEIVEGWGLLLHWRLKSEAGEQARRDNREGDTPYSPAPVHPTPGELAPSPPFSPFPASSSVSASRNRRKTSWDSWLLYESARRTVIMTFLSQGIYEASKYGVCSYVALMAEMSFTRSDTPWNASSYQEWQMSFPPAPSPSPGSPCSKSSPRNPDTCTSSTTGEDDVVLDCNRPLAMGNGLTTYANFTKPWRTMDRNGLSCRVKGPLSAPRHSSRLPTPPDPFGKLLLAPCLGSSYRDALAVPADGILVS